MTSGLKRAMRRDMQRENDAAKKALTLTPALASKIASVVVHADEMMSPSGHHLDRTALVQALLDPEVQAWIKALGVLAPRKR